MAAAPGLIALCIYLVALEAAYGAADPLKNAMLHDVVPAGQRATVVSILSLAKQAGGGAGTLTLPVLAAWAGLPAAWLATAGLLVLAGWPLAGLRRGAPVSGGPVAERPSSPGGSAAS